MDTSTFNSFNTVLDIVLVLASIWMVFAVRGIGGIVGKTLNLVVIGAIVLGIAHLVATLFLPVLNSINNNPAFNGALNNFIHRLVVLLGFVFLIFGFRQMAQLNK